MSKHPSSSKPYLLTFIALIILTIITVAMSYVDLGAFNMTGIIIVASTKMLFVSLVFMGLRYEKGINMILFIGSFAAIIIFFLLTFSDIGYRGTISTEESQIIDIKSPVKLKK